MLELLIPSISMFFVRRRLRSLVPPHVAEVLLRCVGGLTLIRFPLTGAALIRCEVCPHSHIHEDQGGSRRDED